MNLHRSAFFVSDHTGLTTEALAHTLLTQFDEDEFRKETVPFIDTPEKAEDLLGRIKARAAVDHHKPLVFVSIINPELRAKFHIAEVLCFDFFETFMPMLEQELGKKAAWIKGKAHGVDNESKYDARMDAIGFSLDNDDGITNKNLAEADVILLGVSRSGKTPTCLYLALQYGLKTANYPLTPDDLDKPGLPAALLAHKRKLYGLSIDPTRLHQIREERTPNSTYASLQNCQREVREAESMFRQHGIPFISTTHRSIEEIASTVLQKSKLSKKF